MIVDIIGYGAGSRNLKGHPNVLRISLGELNGSAYTLGGSYSVRRISFHMCAVEGTPRAVLSGRRWRDH